jgi:hypothetical protein
VTTHKPRDHGEYPYSRPVSTTVGTKTMHGVDHSRKLLRMHTRRVDD